MSSDPGILLFAIHIAAAAAVFIWAVRLVRTGVERAFAVQHRRILRRSSLNRLLASLSGIGAAICLQSATAVAVLVANLSSKCELDVAAGLAILLGADIGSALVSQVMLLRTEILPSLCLLVGVVLFLRSKGSALRQTGSQPDRHRADLPVTRIDPVGDGAADRQSSDSCGHAVSGRRCVDRLRYRQGVRLGGILFGRSRSTVRDTAGAGSAAGRGGRGDGSRGECRRSVHCLHSHNGRSRSDAEDRNRQFGAQRRRSRRGTAVPAWS